MGTGTVFVMTFGDLSIDARYGSDVIGMAGKRVASEISVPRACPLLLDHGYVGINDRNVVLAIRTRSEIAHGFIADLTIAGANCQASGNDIADLTLAVKNQTKDRLKFEMYLKYFGDSNEIQYRIPPNVVYEPLGDGSTTAANSDLKSTVVAYIVEMVYSSFQVHLLHKSGAPKRRRSESWLLGGRLGPRMSPMHGGNLITLDFLCLLTLKDNTYFVYRDDNGIRLGALSQEVVTMPPSSWTPFRRIWLQLQARWLAASRLQPVDSQRFRGPSLEVESGLSCSTRH